MQRHRDLDEALEKPTLGLWCDAPDILAGIGEIISGLQQDRRSRLVRFLESLPPAPAQPEIHNLRSTYLLPGLAVAAQSGHPGIP